VAEGGFGLGVVPSLFLLVSDYPGEGRKPRPGRGLAFGNQLPGRGKIKVPEFLRQFYGFRHNSLLGVVIPELYVSTQGEILTEWMSLEAVVCKDPTKVWVMKEANPKHIPYFTLKPVGGRIQRRQRVYRGQLIYHGLNP
jgi:hypothetical protein